MRLSIGALLAVAAMPLAVFAQTPAEALKGTWVAEAPYCKQSIVVVTAVEPSGIVRGSFNCTLRGWNPVMGDKIDQNSVKGTLSGNRFKMENADGGGFDVIIEGRTLKGTGISRAGGARNSVVYVKQ